MFQDYRSPYQTPTKIRKFKDWYLSLKLRVKKILILNYLQPFEDVNKRVSRLGVNIPFVQNNLCPLSFIDLPEQAYVDGAMGVYELNQIDLFQDVFVWAYERSCQRFLAITNTM